MRLDAELSEVVVYMSEQGSVAWHRMLHVFVLEMTDGNISSGCHAFINIHVVYMLITWPPLQGTAMLLSTSID